MIMYVLSFSCFCFLGSPPQIKLIQYALVLHFIENMSQLSQVEQNKDYQEISEAAASCEEPSGKWNSDSSAAPHTGSQPVSEMGWELSCGAQTWGRCCCQGHGQSWNIWEVSVWCHLICPSFPPLPPGVPPQPTKHPNTFVFLWLCKTLYNFTSCRVEYVPIMRVIPTFLNWLKDWPIKRTGFFFFLCF